MVHKELKFICQQLIGAEYDTLSAKIKVLYILFFWWNCFNFKSVALPKYVTIWEKVGIHIGTHLMLTKNPDYWLTFFTVIA